MADTCCTTVCGTGGWSGPLPGDPSNNVILSAVAAYGGIDVSWTFPTSNAYAVSHIILYRGDDVDKTFSLAVEQAIVASNYYFDRISEDAAHEYHYWIKVVSINGTVGELIGPASATPGGRVVELLNLLDSQLSESALNQFLRERITRIGGIDTDLANEIDKRANEYLAMGNVLDTVSGKVDSVLSAIEAEITARIASGALVVTSLNDLALNISDTAALLQANLDQEIDDRTNDVMAEQAARILAIQDEIAERAVAIAEESRLRIADAEANAKSLLENAIALHDETLNRIGTVALARQELSTKIDEGVSAEATARLTLAAQVNTNAASIISEQTARATADSALASDISALVTTTNANTAAIVSEQTARTTADSAEALERTVLAAQIRGDYTGSDASLVSSGLIYSERITRASADSAMASDISLLQAEVSGNTADILTEQTARANADSAEASERNTLAVQLRGSYTGTDLSSVATGLIYQERIARVDADESLTQQITLLSAGAGEQFDWVNIWYFDTGVDGWTGNGTPTTALGWIRPADHATDAYIISPTGINSDGNKYGQVRLRIRKYGTPTFAGYLYWKSAADSTWDNSRRIALTEPTYDTNGIGLVSESPGWSVTVDQVKVVLSAAQTATDYYTLDWVAIGRPSPGASSAQLYAEQTARAAADAAEASSRETLSSKLTGVTDPSALTLATLSSGLVYDERVARSTQDTALATSISTLSATVTTNKTTTDAAISAEASARSSADTAETTARQTLSSVVTGATDPTGLTLGTLASGLLFDERTTRSTADSAMAEDIVILEAVVSDNTADILTEASVRASADETEATARQALSTQLTGAADPSGLTLATLSSGLLYDEKTVRTTADESLATSISTLSSTLTSDINAIEADLVTEQTTRADADAATASSVTTLIALNRATEQAANQNAEATLTAILNGEATAEDFKGELALARQELSTRIDAGIDAEATARLELVAVVNANYAAFVSEQTARADAEGAIATDITEMGVLVGNNAAAIVTEQTTRANADTAIASSVTTLAGVVADNAATVQTDYYTKVSADSALAQAQLTIAADYKNTTNNVFRQTSEPTQGTYNITLADGSISSTAILKTNDIWFDSDDGNKPHVYDGASWVYTPDASASASSAYITSLESALTTSNEAKIKSIRDAAAKITIADASLETRLYTDYQSIVGPSGAIAQNKEFLVTRMDAGTSKSFRQTTAPTNRGYDTIGVAIPLQTGDIWFDSDDANKTYAWNGTAWLLPSLCSSLLYTVLSITKSTNCCIWTMRNSTSHIWIILY